MEVCNCTNVYRFTHPSPRKLGVVITKLEPLADQHAIVGFLRNVDDAKRLTGFVQELANAITDYQVRAASPIIILNEHLVRFPYNKEHTRKRETSSVTLKIFLRVLGTSLGTLGTSLGTLEASLGTSVTSSEILRTFLGILRTSLGIPRTS